MSRTYSIGCRQCQKCVWIAQASAVTGNEVTVLYYGNPSIMETLKDFLFEHIGHPLVFGKNIEGELEEFKEIEPTESNVVWAIKGPRGYWGSDGSQSAWLEKVDVKDAYGADTFPTKSAAEYYMQCLAILPDEAAQTHAVPVAKIGPTSGPEYKYPCFIDPNAQPTAFDIMPETAMPRTAMGLAQLALSYSPYTGTVVAVEDNGPLSVRIKRADGLEDVVVNGHTAVMIKKLMTKISLR